MNFLERIAAQLAIFANDALTILKNDGIELAGKITIDVEDEFEKLVGQFGGAATKFVSELFADDKLSGLEKANLATVQLVDHAAQNGVTIAAQHATSLIQSAYLAVKAELAKL